MFWKKEKYWTSESALERAIMGFAIGDALGVPYEFEERERFRCTDMIDCKEDSVHNVPAGTWSDDTSLMLCVLDALCEQGKEDIFTRWSENAIGWMYEGRFSCTDMPFDIGKACRLGILELEIGKKIVRICSII